METEERPAETPCAVTRVDIPKPPSIEDFMVVKPISRGAFGKVFLARKKSNAKLYAIKVVKKAEMVNKNMTEQMRAERDALALSKSPFIVHLYYSLQTASKVYLVMEYLIGGDVKSLLHIYGYFDEDMSIKYISEVAVALDYLHRHGIIHRDLKPDNMLVSNEGHIKLTDFGLSKVKLDRELNLMDILTTPSLVKPKKDYFRTPGQVLSLISSLGLKTTPVMEGKSCGSASAKASPGARGKGELSKGSFCSPLLLRRKERESLRSPLCPSRALAANSVFSPSVLARSLTPRLMKTRKRLETLSAGSVHSDLYPSTTDSEGCISPLWEDERKLEGDENLLPPNGEDGHAADQKPLVTASGKKMVMRTPGKKTPLKVLRKPESRSRPPSTAKTPLGEQTENPLTRFGTCVGFSRDKVSAVKSSSSVKRQFAEVERSPEQVEVQAKKSEAQYRRCFPVPDKCTEAHTGLTGIFSSVDLGNEGAVWAGVGPKQSSPTNVAKNLLCELEEPGEGGCGEGGCGEGGCGEGGCGTGVSGFTSSPGKRRELRRTLSMDNSVNELSAIATTPPRRRRPEACLKTALSSSSSSSSSLEEGELGKAESSDVVLPQVPAWLKQSEVPGGGAELDCSAISQHALVHSSSMVLSPLFLKPRNVVAFRSYCSSINRSTSSFCSRLTSMEEVMDVSTSFCAAPTAVTPVQKKPSSLNSSLYQTPQPMTLSHTPYRTPKSVRRGPGPVEGAPILGTPDYLAPELLLGKSHDVMVDWWALGVCLFEFLTGVPPFNDETPQLVFQNILNRDIPWPDGDEELSPNSRSAIEILLTTDVTERAGLKELQRHPFFQGLVWDELQHQAMPFIPQPDDETDTSYFEARNAAQHLAMSGFSL